MFIQPGHVPTDVALAIWRVMCNQASADDWELFDRYPRGQIMAWVRAILIANDVKRLEEEMVWWGKQLTRPDN